MSTSGPRAYTHFIPTDIARLFFSLPLAAPTPAGACGGRNTQLIPASKTLQQGGGIIHLQLNWGFCYTELNNLVAE